ncbi:MAG: DUF2634 domain-containing protein [Oscillospiraceae bacterium]|jgi:hypothetical protein|nr:DUF2634 domain-containing protein [Oscillospiraceae bacterium]
MTNQLFPTFPVSPITAADNAPAPKFPRGYLFDCSKGEFVLDSGKTREADETDTWIQWCIKAALTQRYAYLAYSRGYGAELEEAMALGGSAAQSGLETTIREALLADPHRRTAQVKDFEFSVAEDSTTVSFTVVSERGKAERLNITI